MLAIILIISPVMIMMWIKIQKAEIRIERKEKQVNQQLRELREK